jgi:hypothetical protein
MSITGTISAGPTVSPSPRFTERQKSYARAIGSRTIYTPQFIIGGTDRLEGYEPNVTEAAMAERLNSAPAAAVHLAGPAPATRW